jgi:hypothetical protein
MTTWKHEPAVATPAGPWDDEPDKAQWVDQATGLDCLIVRNHYGALCGYVGLPPGHRLYGRDYNDPAVYDAGLSAHCGITFADHCHDDDRGPGYGICHTPAPGRPADVWWLGFDCAHWRDLVPGMQYSYDGGVYRDFGYVTDCVTMLARELAAVT